MALRAFFCVCLYVTILPLALLGRKGERDSNSICDDGRYKIEEDLGGLENWKCQGNLFQITEFLEPSYHEECSDTHKEFTVRCMDTPLDYDSHPPSSGDYRPLRPKYGDYQYLPPQRWLGALKYGAVAFLYHPCAPQDQVAQLKQLAQSCLWRHFISPYPHLTSQWPMALVSWGCVLRVSWMETDTIRDWISSHALKEPLTKEVTTNGVYDEGLLHNATVVEVDGEEVVCPQLHTPTLPNSPSTQNTLTDPPTPTVHDTEDKDDEDSKDVSCSLPPSPTVRASPTARGQKFSPEQDPSQMNHSSSSSPCPQPLAPTCCSTQTQSSQHLHLHHHVGYIILTTMAAVVLLGVVIAFMWNVRSANGRNRRRARYKSVSKFFPFAYGQQTDSSGIAIPEYGLPKTGQAERETLLNESDEDEI